MDTSKNASTPNFLEKIWVKYGLIGGFIAIVITTIYYVFDDSLFTDMVFSTIPLLAILITSIVAAYKLRVQQGQYLAYSQGVTTSLGAFTIGIILSSGFSILLYYVIDPDLLKKITNMQLKRVAKMVDEGQLPKESYEEMARRLAEQGPEMFLFNQLLGVVSMIVIALIIFLISSAFLRKEPKI
ncbi:MAG: DUF4199 domain-containing protein [Bacteroidia bacterium]